MSIRPFQDRHPVIDSEAYVDPAAVVVGDVVIAAESSIWPMAVVRGDVNYIRIGRRTNIQDGSVLHVTHDHAGSPGGRPLFVGDEVTVGHAAVLHGCTVGDRCLIGIGSILLDGAVLEPEVMLGAGTLVPPGKRLAGGHLYVGSPARSVRRLSAAEQDWLAYSAAKYLEIARAHRSGRSVERAENGDVAEVVNGG